MSIQLENSRRPPRRLDVHWLQQAEKDVPSDIVWLSASELAYLQNMRFAKRRADWLLGRWTAKRAVAACLHDPDNPLSLASLEVRPAASGAPEVFISNRPAASAISLSHRSGVAICAVGPPHMQIGCDLEVIEPRSDAFVSDYFTPEEQALVARTSTLERPTLLALLWSAKESALKAMQVGLRLDTRTARVSFPQEGPVEPQTEPRNRPFTPPDSPNLWQPLQVDCEGGVLFEGWWQREGQFLRTLVAAPAPGPPIALSNGGRT